MSKTWKLMKLAFRYYSLGFQRIIFMILGAEIAFILCYAFYVKILIGTAVPMLPVPYAAGGDTLAGAMVVAGAVAIVYTIQVLLGLAAIALIVGYVKHYLVVLSYYDEQKYAAYIKLRGSPIPSWMQDYAIGKEAEFVRLMAIEECKRACKNIRAEME